MKLGVVVGLSIVVIFNMCDQQIPKGSLKTENAPNQQNKSDELRINNGQYRRAEYTDSMGSIYNLRYMPITITNDDTIPKHLQIAFEKEYKFPIANSQEKFYLIPMLMEWAIEVVGITDSMMDELPKYLSKPNLNRTLEPNEELLFAIGTLYRRGKTGGLLPNSLFTYRDGEVFSECDWLLKDDISSYSQMALGFKLSISGLCVIIPCGKTSYSEN